MHDTSYDTPIVTSLSSYEKELKMEGEKETGDQKEKREKTRKSRGSVGRGGVTTAQRDRK
jgi:hypothetical protein